MGYKKAELNDPLNVTAKVKPICCSSLLLTTTERAIEQPFDAKSG